jgi:hypothetical protein
MLKENKKPDPQEKDLIDQIADALPIESQAAYYREMRHLRSLPENDEMLRILRAIMFLTLLTEQVPRRVLTEREHLERICSDFLITAKGLSAKGSEYYKQLDSRLIQLPESISKGINPKAIVELINDNLKKQFAMSTIPIVAGELKSSADTIRTAAIEYTQTTEELSVQWRSASSKARDAIWDINSAVSEAVRTSEEATKTFTRAFRKTYHRMLWVICAGTLLV